MLNPGSARGVQCRNASDVAVVVEIFSTSTEATDRSLKVIKYAEAGVPAYWRVAREVRCAAAGRYEDGGGAAS